MVIFGASYLGNFALAGLRGAGIEPLAFCDNNVHLWGSAKEGIRVLSPAEAAARYRDSTAFVVAIHNSSAPRTQLRELGVSRVIPYPMLFWKYWRTMPAEDRLQLPERILERASEIAPAYEQRLHAARRWSARAFAACGYRVPRPECLRDVRRVDALARAWMSR